MAFVYEATDLRLGRHVALKLLAPPPTQESDFRERFMRESRFAASLDHPNIVPIYEAGEADGLLFIAMRFVGGVNLDTRLHKVTRLDRHQALAVLAPIADALDMAHAAGLVHRDVKPANILLGTAAGRPRARLSDRLRNHQADVGSDEADRHRQRHRNHVLHRAGADPR